MTKLYRMYQALKGFNANSIERAMSASELVHKAGLGDIKEASTQLAQLASKRGVLSRTPMEQAPGLPKVYKYWVVGEYKGRTGEPKTPAPVLAKKKRRYIRRQVAQVKAGEYKLTITGPDMILERTVSNGLLARVINTLIEQ